MRCDKVQHIFFADLCERGVWSLPSSLCVNSHITIPATVISTIGPLLEFKINRA